MSKVEAYICDRCSRLVKAEQAQGMTQQEELFDHMRSYIGKSVDPAKYDIHHCMDCYREQCIIIADSLVNRKKDENAYKNKLAELHYNLRRQCVMNFVARNHPANKQGRKKS